MTDYFQFQSEVPMVTRTKKIFVGGLSASSTVEDMKSYFEQYGKIEDAMLMFDKTTQRHRGFGFVTFESEEVVEKVTEIHFHEINGKMVECKKAQPKEVMLPVQMNKNRAAAARSLYGLAPDQLLAYSSLVPRFGAGAFGATSPLYYHPVLNGYKGWASAAGPTSPSAAATAAALMGHSAFGAPGGAPSAGGMSTQAQLEAALYTAMCNNALSQSAAAAGSVDLQAAMSQSFSAAATPASPQPGSYAAAALAAAAAQQQHQASAAAQQHQQLHGAQQQPFAHPAAAQHMHHIKQQTMNAPQLITSYNGHY